MTSSATVSTIVFNKNEWELVIRMTFEGKSYMCIINTAQTIYFSDFYEFFNGDSDDKKGFNFGKDGENIIKINKDGYIEFIEKDNKFVMPYLYLKDKIIKELVTCVDKGLKFCSD